MPSKEREKAVQGGENRICKGRKEPPGERLRKGTRAGDGAPGRPPRGPQRGELSSLRVHEALSLPRPVDTHSEMLISFHILYQPRKDNCRIASLGKKKKKIGIFERNVPWK